jgi:hypothetical protein
MYEWVYVCMNRMYMLEVCSKWVVRMGVYVYEWMYIYVRMGVCMHEWVYVRVNECICTYA